MEKNMTDQTLGRAGSGKPQAPAGKTVVPQRSPEVAAFLARLGPSTSSATAGRGRLIFALDATASREPTWDQACHVQAEMFEATAALGGIETQLVYYRGHDECRASRWVTSAGALHRLMSTVQCQGGYTQTARLFSHAVRETKARKVGAVIFVGDAFEEKIDDVCAPAGELGKLGTPVFVFQEGALPEATAAFRQIAQLSGGAHLAFSLDAIGRLKELLGAVAAYAAGGYQALESYGAKKKGAVLQLTSQLRR
jgi:hypothetical protein